MSTRTIVVAAAVGAAAVTVLTAALFAPDSGRALPAPPQPLALRATFVPAAAGFGDTVGARIVVTMDVRAVRPFTLHVVYGTAPLTQLGRAVERRMTRGALSVATVEVRAACLSSACVASSGRRAVAPAPVRADVALRFGGRTSATAAWTPLAVSGRVAPADLAKSQPPFRADTTPPPAGYRIRPGLLAALLVGAAALLAACAAALVASALLGARGPRQEAELDELDRALLLARSARKRPERDRRAATGYLARLLARRDEPLAHAADELAWSRRAPSADSLTELVEGIERERPA